ncbi:MAG: hypothetical protein LC742_02240, partial [Acidobacteria bacterium]|nr:hypothetical protein [Acidobacteriota bacterium]
MRDVRPLAQVVFNLPFRITVINDEQISALSLIGGFGAGFIFNFQYAVPFIHFGSASDERDIGRALM